jgi:ankyrin repeat protein
LCIFVLMYFCLQVRALLEAGADPTLRGGDGGTTALHDAVAGGNTGVVKQLLAALATATPSTETGRTETAAAAGAGAAGSPSSSSSAAAADADAAPPPAVRTLLRGINATDGEGRTPLMAAATERLIGSVRLLLAAGADPNARSNDGEPALLMFVHSERNVVECVDALLKAGADANAAAPDGRTALWAAAHAGNTKLVKLLLAFGAGVDAKSTLHDDDTKAQRSVLQAALAGDNPNVEVVKALLGAGSRPSADDLAYAESHSVGKAVKKLLRDVIDKATA